MPSIVRFVLEADIDRLCSATGRGAVALVLEQQAFRDIEGEIDRIDRVDRRQQGCGAAVAAGDEATGIDAAIRDLAADRRTNAGELEVKRTLPHHGVSAGDVRLRRARGRAEV